MKNYLILLACLVPLNCSDDEAASKDLGREDQRLGSDQKMNGDNGSPDRPVVDSSLIDATTVADTSTVNFSTVVQPLFTAKCASSTCHGGTAPKANLNLSTGEAYQNLVGVAAFQCPTLKRVEPGDTSKSYLVQKLAGSGDCYSGSKMPASGTMSETEIGLVHTWITTGAKED